MQNHHWLAAGLLLAASAAVSQQRPGERERVPGNTPANETRANGEAGGNKQPPASAPIPVRVVESENQRTSREEREEDARQDEAANLKAQERAAVAAEKQVEVGWAAFWLSLVGAFGLFGTIYYARQASREASRASSAAIDSARVAQQSLALAQDTALRQIRAYVHTGAITLHVPERYERDRQKRLAPGHEIVLAIETINAGQTPARQLRFFVNFLISPGDQGVPADFEYLDGAREPRFPSRVANSQVSLAPGRSVTHTVALNDLEYDGLIEAHLGLARMFVYGRVEYFDIYETGRSTKFCLELKVGQKPEHGFSPMTYVGPHNDAN